MTPGVLLAAVLIGVAVGAATSRAPATERLARLRSRQPEPGRPASRVVGATATAGAVLRRGRERAQERERAVEACTALAAELRAGRSPEVALEQAAGVATGSTGRALRVAAATARVGGDPAARLADDADSTAAPHLLRGLAACWSVCATSGAGLATAVERLEGAERDRQERRRAVAAELAGPRATARLLAVLPLLGVLLAAALGAAPLSFLLGTAIGRVCLLTGVLLDAAGGLWTRRLVARAAGA